jgi:hypothetical protein
VNEVHVRLNECVEAVVLHWGDGTTSRLPVEPACPNTTIELDESDLESVRDATDLTEAEPETQPAPSVWAPRATPEAVDVDECSPWITEATDPNWPPPRDPARVAEVKAEIIREQRDLLMTIRDAEARIRELSARLGVL